MPEVYVSLGSNVDRDRHVPSALAALERHFGRLTVSSIYDSEPVGFEGDPFYNLVVGFESELPVQQISQILADIEIEHGRTRDSKKFEARTLDLDLLLYGDTILHEGRIKIPRDELMRYAFMLEPLAEIAPDRRHPVTQETYAELWRAYDKSKALQRRVVPAWANR